MVELLIGGGILLLFISIIILLANKGTNKKVVTFHSNNPEDFKKFMEQNNFPPEMIQNMNIGKNGSFKNVTTTKTMKTVKYVNGQKVSEETHNENSNYTPLTNCPNCGATLEPGNTGVCRYCNTSFNTYQINNQ